MADHKDDDDWSVTSTRRLIDFYKKSRELWDKNHEDNSNKSKTNKVLPPQFQSLRNKVLFVSVLTTSDSAVAGLKLLGGPTTSAKVTKF